MDDSGIHLFGCRAYSERISTTQGGRSKEYELNSHWQSTTATSRFGTAVGTSVEFT